MDNILNDDETVKNGRTGFSVGSRQVYGLKRKPCEGGSVNTFAEHKNQNSKNTGVVSTSANGGSTLKNSTIRKIRTESIEQLMYKTGKFEFFWYPTFLILGLLCLILVPIATSLNTAGVLLLVFSVLSLWLSMTGNNLTAKGYRTGMLICTINMIIYVGISFYQKVWGEVIINALIYIPLEIYGFFKWKKNEELINATGKRNEDVYKMNGKEWLIYGSLLVVLTVVVWALLQFVLKQSYAIFNAISIAGCIVGDLARNKRFFETWYFFMVCNIGGIILWALQIFGGGGDVTFAILPTMISFLATLSNNFNGLYIWNYLHNKTCRNGGVYLAKRKVSIQKIAKIKRTFKKMTCKETH